MKIFSVVLLMFLGCLVEYMFTSWQTSLLSLNKLTCHYYIYVDVMELISRLNFSPHRLAQTEPDSISQMDMAVFLLHTAYTARSRQQEHRSVDNSLKVSDLTASLCTEEQAQWWSAVYDSCGQTTATLGWVVLLFVIAESTNENICNVTCTYHKI